MGCNSIAYKLYYVCIRITYFPLAFKYLINIIQPDNKQP